MGTDGETYICILNKTYDNSDYLSTTLVMALT